MSRRGARGAEVVTIFWRDIPAQVNGQDGRERHQVLLSSKFQRAVDRAKRKAGIYTAEEDIAQWRRTSEACSDGVDHATAADARAEALEAEYSREYLGKLAYAGGFAADVTDVDVDRDVLLALEELEDEAEEATWQQGETSDD
jgi:Virulence factor